MPSIIRAVLRFWPILLIPTGVYVGAYVLTFWEQHHPELRQRVYQTARELDQQQRSFPFINVTWLVGEEGIEAFVRSRL